MIRRFALAALGGLLLLVPVLAPATAVAAPTPVLTTLYTASYGMPTAFAVSHGRLLATGCSANPWVATIGGESPGQPPHDNCNFNITPGGVAASADGATMAISSTSRNLADPVLHLASFLAVYAVPDGAYVTSIVTSTRESVGQDPDGTQQYGVVRYPAGADPACVDQALDTSAHYTGVRKTGLSAVAAGQAGTWYVADRAGNTIYRVSTGSDGALAVSILAVLAPVRVRVSAALAATYAWPACVVGSTIAFEASPDEVEVGPDGTVYVAGLPRILRAAATNSVLYRIPTQGRRAGQVHVLPNRFAGVVELAVDERSRLLVAHGDSEITRLTPTGWAWPYAQVPDVVGVETDETGTVYAQIGFRAAPDIVVRQGSGRFVRLG